MFKPGFYYRLITSLATKGSYNSFLTPKVVRFYPVYRLEEDDSLLQEGGVRLSVWTLRARSYKSRAEAQQQGSASILSKGFIMVYIPSTCPLVHSRNHCKITTFVTGRCTSLHLFVPLCTSTVPLPTESGNQLTTRSGNQLITG